MEETTSLQVPLRYANKIMKKLLKKNLLLKTLKFKKNKTHIIFPIKKHNFDKKCLKKHSAIVSIHSFPKKEIKESLKDKLKSILTPKQFKLLKLGRDNIGTITILEIPTELIKKEKQIAKIILDSNPHIKTVLKKTGSHTGNFRIQKYKFLTGIKTKETIHKENGVRLKLNIEQVYFSIRLGTERKRIQKLIKKNEEILVMFSGCAPYPCVLAKNTLAKKIVGIELNPKGQEYGIENLRLNNITNVDLYKGDAQNSLKLTQQTFDRIIMPLPRNASLFLESAFKVAKKGTMIHLYHFVEEKNIQKESLKLIKLCEQYGRVKLINIIKAGQHSPRKFRVCFDIKILNRNV